MATPVTIGSHRNCVLECNDTAFWTPKGEMYRVIDNDEPYADRISNRCVYKTQRVFPMKNNQPTRTIITASCGWWGGGYRPQALDGTRYRFKDLDVVQDEQGFIMLDELYLAGSEIRNSQLKFIILNQWRDIKPMRKTEAFALAHFYENFYATTKSRQDHSHCLLKRNQARDAYLRMIKDMALHGVVVRWENYRSLGTSFLDFVWFSDDLLQAYPIGIPYIDKTHDTVAPTDTQAMQVISSNARAEFDAWYPESTPTELMGSFKPILRLPLCKRT
ncbi:hypothetical protein FRC02_009176 [Tulasnella sp. 418]|nr:hypothetical protein FRC02_009176 [Tulasnella sp. 418]